MNNKHLFIRACVFLAIMSSSFDIFANVTIVGLNFRFTQFIMMPVAVLGIMDFLVKGKFKRDLYIIPLILWCILQALFVMHSPNFMNAFMYLFWLVFDIMTALMIVFYCGRAYSWQWLIRVYLNSFVFLAVFGLVQFILYFLGINLYVTQMWNSKFARINGFCFEPSFYATYMLVGFIILAYLLETKNRDIFTKKQLFWRFGIVFLALFLSTSRMGWLMMGMWLAVRVLLCIKKIKMRKRIVPVVVLGFLSAVAGTVFVVESGINLLFLLQGLGIAGTLSHSSTTRINGLYKSIEIFMDHPLYGYSLGGVDPIMAEYLGITYDSSLNGLATSIIGEMLVSGGIIGTLLFVTFVLGLLYKGLRTKYPIGKALTWALLFELMILCFNQNVLRVYVWILLGVIFAYYKIFRCNTYFVEGKE